MDRVEYLVCRRDGRWTLVHDGRETGHYDTREVAVSVGIDAANGAGLQGAEAVVSRASADHSASAPQPTRVARRVPD